MYSSELTQEMSATIEVLAQPDLVITDEEADRILNSDIIIEDIIPKLETITIYPTTDSKEVLKAFFIMAVKKNIPKIQRDLILCLCFGNTITGLVDENNNPMWVEIDKVDSLFSVSIKGHPKGYTAWYLSQPPGSKYYCGEWFERMGKFLTDPSGVATLSNSEIPKFRTHAYRIRREAITLIGELCSH